ncbi:SDR family NAD(P)-dependent oxidoreductase [Novosphingobium bradum]|uniref:SDR family NAD(P)-dependent oxidoreductase n=1 Tax=Novosphingobium bradum TaxID=1737444 RepID=A0ABV7IRM6_9SPHN
MEFAARYGPWALIAGASEGTGREFARQVAAQGLNCVLVARRDAPLAVLAGEITAEFGVECLTVALDLADPAAADHLLAAIGERDVGLFVANAGSDPHGARLLDRPAQDWRALIRRNVMTLFDLCYHFAGTMKARGRGGMVLVNSGACYGGATYMAIYSATKAFDLNFGEALWAELKPFGVDVLNLVMGETDTPELRRFLAAKGLPLPASVASAADVAALGLAQLPHGPVCNWGRAGNEGSYGVFSADARRERVEMIEQMAKPFFEKGG